MASLDILLNNRFRLESKISAGSFGTVYRGLDVHTGDKVAIKIELASAPHPQLSYEYKIYEFLQSTESPEARIGIPRVHWYGREGHYFVLVIDLLGCSLEDLFNLCNRKFSLKTTLMLGDQMISRIQYMHNKGYIHRDIKPDNFVIGREEFFNCVFSIDFGLAKRFRDPETLKHIPYTNNRSLIGTARYASVHSHIGVEQSRRDDLEAIGYVLVYFLKGSLPWQGLKGGTKAEKFAGINDSKMGTSLETLCLGLPQEFLYYFQHIRALSFEEKPDYLYLRRLFRELFYRIGYKYDLQYDWTGPLQESKYAKNIFSSTAITLQEQIYTNTNFLLENEQNGINNTNNDENYDNDIDFHSMSFVLDSDVLEYYRQIAHDPTSQLHRDISQRYNNPCDVISLFGDDYDQDNDDNNEYNKILMKNYDQDHEENQNSEEEEKKNSKEEKNLKNLNSTDLTPSDASNTTTTKDTYSGTAIISNKNTFVDTGNDQIEDILSQNIENNPEKNPEKNERNEPVLGLHHHHHHHEESNPQKDEPNSHHLHDSPHNKHLSGGDHPQNSKNSKNDSKIGENSKNDSKIDVYKLKNRPIDGNIRRNDGSFIEDPINPSADTESWTRQLAYLLEVKTRDEQQREIISQHQSSSQRQIQSSLSSSTPTQQLPLRQVTDFVPTKVVSNRESKLNKMIEFDSTLHLPTNLEMLGTIQFSQKQYHSLTLFLQLLCKQILYLENTLRIIISKANVVKKHLLTQVDIDKKFTNQFKQPLVLSSSPHGSGNYQHQQHNQYNNQGHLIINNDNDKLSTGSSHSSTSSTSTANSSLQYAIFGNGQHGGYNTTLLDVQTPNQAHISQNHSRMAAEEISMLFDLQIVVIEQQIQFTRSQQQIIMNSLVCLHNYMRSLLLEHQQLRVNQIVGKINSNNGGSSGGNDGENNYLEGILGNTFQHSDIKLLQLQSQRQYLQSQLKKFYSFDYSNLFDQRVQTQRLFLQLKSLQDVKENQFFQFMYILRQRHLLPFYGHPFTPNPHQIRSPHRAPRIKNSSIDIAANNSTTLLIDAINSSTTVDFDNLIEYTDNPDEEKAMLKQVSLQSYVDIDQQLTIRANPQALLIGGPVTPTNSVHALALGKFTGLEDLLDVSLGPIKEYLELNQRLICLNENNTMILADQEQMIKMATAADQTINLLKKHRKHHGIVNKRNDRNVEATGERLFCDKITIKDHNFYDPDKNQFGNDGQQDKDDKNGQINDKNDKNSSSSQVDPTSASTTTASGLKLTKGKTIRRPTVVQRRENLKLAQTSPQRGVAPGAVGGVPGIGQSGAIPLSSSLHGQTQGLDAITSLPTSLSVHSTTSTNQNLKNGGGGGQNTPSDYSNRANNQQYYGPTNQNGSNIPNSLQTKGIKQHQTPPTSPMAQGTPTATGNHPAGTIGAGSPTTPGATTTTTADGEEPTGAGGASSSTTSNTTPVINPLKPGDDDIYITPPSDAFHPSIRSSLTNLAGVHFSPEDIKRIEQLPRLRDFGFHMAVNTLLQLEFENPNTIHMYILYRKYLKKRSKYPRHYPILTEPQSVFDFGISNDVNNVSSVLKLLLFYIKTLPNTNKNIKNGGNGHDSRDGSDNDEEEEEEEEEEEDSIYNSISSQLESLLAMEQNQLISHLANTNLYPRVFDQLLMKNPGFIRQLLHLSHDKYSYDTIVSVLKNANIPLPGEHHYRDLSKEELNSDGIDVGVEFEDNSDSDNDQQNGDIIFTQKSQQEQEQQLNDDEINEENDKIIQKNKNLNKNIKNIPLNKKASLAQTYFLSLFPQDEKSYIKHNKNVEDGIKPISLTRFTNGMAGDRFYRDPQTGLLHSLNILDLVKHVENTPTPPGTVQIQSPAQQYKQKQQQQQQQELLQQQQQQYQQQYQLYQQQQQQQQHATTTNQHAAQREQQYQQYQQQYQQHAANQLQHQQPQHYQQQHKKGQ